MKKILVLTIIILVIVIVVLVLGGNARKNLAVSSPTPKNPTPTFNQTVRNGLALVGFPTDIPVEAGAIITKNSSTTSSAGQILAIYEFISKKTVADNFMLYKNSLPPNRWAISIALDSTIKKIINATKGNVQVKITISKNQSNQVVVSIQATTTK
jgi:hypothetical protein